MSAPLESYLRTYRKRSGFSQDEVAFLLGCRSKAKVSRYERSGRQPALQTVFAYELILRVPVSHLFAGIYQKVENAMRARALLLAAKLAAERISAKNLHKIAALKLLASGLPAPHH